jgi:hypothetical protein
MAAEFIGFFVDRLQALGKTLGQPARRRPQGSSRRQTSSTTSAGGVHSLSSSTIWP